MVKDGFNTTKKVSPKERRRHLLRSKHLPKLAKLSFNAKAATSSMPAHAIPITKYEDRTANGLTKCIIHFIRYNGGQAERISNTGRFIDTSKVVQDVLGNHRKIGTGTWIPGTGTNGTADISSTVPILINGIKAGISVKWEVKIGADKQSDDQKAYQKSVEESGGVYYLVHSFDDFYEKYLQLIQRYL